MINNFRDFSTKLTKFPTRKLPDRIKSSISLPSPFFSFRLRQKPSIFHAINAIMCKFTFPSSPLYVCVRLEV